MATLTAKQAPSTAVGDGVAAGAAAPVLRMVSSCERDHAASEVIRTVSGCERRAICGRCGVRIAAGTATSAWDAAAARGEARARGESIVRPRDAELTRIGENSGRRFDSDRYTTNPNTVSGVTRRPVQVLPHAQYNAVRALLCAECARHEWYPIR